MNSRGHSKHVGMSGMSMLTLLLTLMSALPSALSASATTLTSAGDSATAPRYGFVLSATPSQLISMDKYQRKYQRHKSSVSLEFQLNRATLPSDSDAFAADYGYPTFSLGMRYSINDVTMRRTSDPAWGLAEMVDYDSRLGNQISAYLLFTRPFFRHKRWSADYSLGTGIGYSHLKYNPVDNVDNELIGSRFLIYFAAGFHATYRIASQWGIRAGADYYHLSNGALNRPNKGANFIGASIGVQYFPYYDEVRDKGANENDVAPRRHPRSGIEGAMQGLFSRVTVGVGGKVLNEEWQHTQFRTRPGDPGYRTNRFHFYTAYSLSADLMYRYARRWASGIGADVFYGPYASRVEEIDTADGISTSHSPWSVGISAKHSVYYHRLSLDGAVGVYLYRHMGANAEIIEKPYYERIGLSYSFPFLGGVSLGASVKAHLTKADFTELTLSVPIRIK